MVFVAIRPEVRVVTPGEMTGSHMTLLRQWVELNRDVIMRYWDREISTRNALDALKPISANGMKMSE
jgi:hypothetical protein